MYNPVNIVIGVEKTAQSCSSSRACEQKGGWRASNLSEELAVVQHGITDCYCPCPFPAYLVIRQFVINKLGVLQKSMHIVAEGCLTHKWIMLGNQTIYTAAKAASFILFHNHLLARNSQPFHCERIWHKDVNDQDTCTVKEFDYNRLNSLISHKKLQKVRSKHSASCI